MELGYCLRCKEEVIGEFKPFLIHLRCGEPCAVIHYPNEDCMRDIEFMSAEEVDKIIEKNGFGRSEAPSKSVLCT